MSHLRVTARQFAQQPATYLVAVLTLGLGIGASAAVFTLVNAVLLGGLPYPEADRLMSLGRGSADRQSSSHRDVQFLREHVRTCGPIAATVPGSGLNVELGGRVSYERDRLVSHEYFEALGIQPQWGRGFRPADDVPNPPPVVIVTERFLARHELDPAAVVGQPILLGGRAHEVIGVVANRHTRPSDASVLRPLGQDSRGGGQNLDVLCRLAADATPGSLDGELLSLTDAARRAKLAGDRSPRAYGALSRHEWEFGPLRPALVTLGAAVGLVLLVAASNTTGLLLVRATGRRREMAVRTALGASPRRLVRRLVAEGLVLAGAAGALGLAVSPLLVRGLLAVAPPYYATLATFSLDGVVVLATALICLLVGLAVSLPPVLEVLQVNVRDALHDEGRSSTPSRRAQWTRHALIGAETAICAVLLVGAVLLLRTFINLVTVPTGVDTAGVVTARMSVQGPRYANHDTLLRFFEEGIARLEQTPGIAAAAVAASLPAERALNLPATLPGSATPTETRVVNWRYVSPSYLSLLGIPVVAGRGIAVEDRAGAPAIALVNETFARQIYGGVSQALGQLIAVSRQPAREVVGVVADTSGWSLADAPRPMMFVPLAQVEPAVAATAHSFFPPRWIVRGTGPTDEARRALDAVVRSLDPTQPFIDIQTLDALLLGSVATQRFYLAVLMAFACVAVGLAAVGVYASYSYAVAERTSEIGVRLALGAAPSGILRGVVSQGLTQAAVAIAVGLAVAAGASRVLRSVLFNVSETDPLTYGGVATVLLATVFLATILPARRAARMDPLGALRR